MSETIERMPDEGAPLQVRTALQPAVMGRYLSDALSVPVEKGACRILNVKYEPGDYCMIVYQLGNELLTGIMRWSAADASTESPAAAYIAPLGMHVYHFKRDPALPGLEPTLNPTLLSQQLAATLPELRNGSRHLAHLRTTLLRYRPGRRCTLRIELWERDLGSGGLTRRTLYGKVYHDLAKAAAVYQEMQLLAGTLHGHPETLALAQPVAFLPNLALVLQAPATGLPLEDLLSGFARAGKVGEPRLRNGIVCSAAAVAALHSSGLTTERRRPIDDELARFKKRAGQAERVNKATGALLMELAETLPAWRPALPEWGEQLTIVHGDCKPSQFLITAAGVVMLDFDHCGMADPAVDVGTYLATLRQIALWQPDRRRKPALAAARAQQLELFEELFLHHYCAQRGLGPEFRRRATWYEAVALLRKALRAFARSAHASLPVLMVAEAWRCLEALPLPSHATTVGGRGN